MSSARALGVTRAGRLTKSDRHSPRQKLAWLLDHRAQILASIAVASLLVGGLLYVIGEGPAGQLVWRATVALLAAALAVEVGRTVVVEHSLGVDTIALVAIVGALVLGQELAGVVIGLMFSGGESLEGRASRRARRGSTWSSVRLRSRSCESRTNLEEVPVERLKVGDHVLVRTGEVVPVDGTVLLPRWRGPSSLARRMSSSRSMATSRA